MQLLALLTLDHLDATLAEPGELFESLLTALVCDRDHLHDAVRTLTERQLANRQDGPDGDQRILITTAGFIAVQSWLDQATLLCSADGPPDHPAADDATG